MRLGQLARHLDTTTTEIVRYLAENKIQIKDHPNIKLDENTQNLVIEAFTSSPQADDSPELPHNDDEEVNEMPTTVEHTGKEEVHDPKEEVETTEPAVEEPVSTEPQAEVEVIKAPKVKLPGLTVIGKIDLPEPAPKQVSPETDDTATPEQTAKTKKGKRPGREKLSAEERERRRIKSKKARERRERIQQEKKQKLEQQRLKEQKREYYLRKINPPAATKEAPKAHPKAVKHKKEQQASGSLLSRFWKWLNS